MERSDLFDRFEFRASLGPTLHCLEDWGRLDLWRFEADVLEWAMTRFSCKEPVTPGLVGEWRKVPPLIGWATLARAHDRCSVEARQDSSPPSHSCGK